MELALKDPKMGETTIYREQFEGRGTSHEQEPSTLPYMQHTNNQPGTGTRNVTI